MKRMCRMTMSKKILFAVLFVLFVLFVFISCVAGCVNNTTFSGSKTSNDNQFLVDFDVLNSAVNSKMLLLQSEKIETTIDVKKGDLDIIVKNENGIIAYQGNSVESCKFIIEIEVAGTYTFYITGTKAKGSVYFIKL